MVKIKSIHYVEIYYIDSYNVQTCIDFKLCWHICLFHQLLDSLESWSLGFGFTLPNGLCLSKTCTMSSQDEKHWTYDKKKNETLIKNFNCLWKYLSWYTFLCRSFFHIKIEKRLEKREQKHLRFYCLKFYELKNTKITFQLSNDVFLLHFRHFLLKTFLSKSK